MLANNFEINSISEILAEKGDLDMSTIKEMVESLEEDSLYFINNAQQKATKHREILSVNSFDGLKQNSIDKIIKYMKKEIHKIDRLKSKEKNKEKVQNLIKKFILSLKQIDISNANQDENQETNHLCNNKVTRSNTDNYFDNDEVLIEEQNKFIKEMDLPFNVENHESIQLEEENFDKEFLEPIPNKLPPLTFFSSKSGSPKKSEKDYNLLSEPKHKSFKTKFSKSIKNKKYAANESTKDEYKTPKFEPSNEEFSSVIKELPVQITFGRNCENSELDKKSQKESRSNDPEWIKPTFNEMFIGQLK